jgi:valyl-tRNA synthetase
MPKVDVKSIEEKWKKFWKEKEIFKFDLKKGGKIYSVDTPPPYISGNMHIGHAFSYSQQDFIARFMRMYLGKKGQVFYTFGTDDNGLPTERFIEKINKVKSREMGRTEFIKLCLKTLKEVTPEHIKDFIDLGISADYELYYSTIDDNTRKISQKSFIDLYKEGEAYKKNFPTMWCSECQTSIAQAELEDKEENSLFSTLKFFCEGKDLLIATTRPELLEACVAVFVHPKDKRYKNFVGKKAKVPLFDFEVPIIADESAEMEKGTGILMVCSYGDRFDVDAINRHGLEEKVVIDKQGRIKNLKVKDYRKKVLKELEEKGLIKEQKQIEHVVNVHDKCGTAIEFIPTKQWFIKILDKKKKLIEQGNKINWYPDFMHKRYDNWVKGLEWDWSISRNRHFGVPIPVWECSQCGEIILPLNSELPVDPLQTKKKCPKCKKEAEPEKMVLDTWATSSLTPQIASSLVKGNIEIPFSLRPQGHDIIRTWAFYTIVKSYLHEKKIPWKNIVISGNVSLGGEKMSKSKGNSVNPREVLEKYGADALRFWAAGSKLGNDLDYQEKDLIAGKKIINKIFNASNFVFMNLKDYDGKKKPEKLEALDEVFLNELNKLIDSSTKNFKNYEYSKVKQDVEQFFWNDFCDNYLEIVKKRVYQSAAGSNEKLSAQYTLYNSLLKILKMLSPIMPFITEEIYQEYFKKFEKDKSIHLSSWPEFEKKKKFNEEWERFKQIISKVRQEKSKAQKPMNSEIVLSLKKEDINFIEDLKNVSGAKVVKMDKKFEVEFVD